MRFYTEEELRAEGYIEAPAAPRKKFDPSDPATVTPGERPGLPPKAGETPLHVAAEHGKHPAIIQTLLNGGAYVNATDAWGQTPLHRAAGYNSNPDITKALLDAGANADAEDERGNTPLDLARESKNWGAVQVLEEAGR